MKDKGLRLVSQNTDEQVERNRALAEIEFPLRELAANLMRSTAGGGRPEEIPFQVQTVFNKFLEFEKRVDALPTAKEVRSLLTTDPYLDFSAKRVPSSDPFGEGETLATRGALRMTASALLGQLTQLQNASHGFYDGVRILEEAREQSSQGKFPEL